MGRCGYHTDPKTGHRYHVPGCMGGAAMGKSYCTCSTESARKKREASLAETLERIEERLSKLEARD